MYSVRNWWKSFVSKTFKRICNAPLKYSQAYRAVFDERFNVWLSLQAFAVFAGWLTDVIGLESIYILFVILAFLNIPFILKEPSNIEKICKPH